MNHLKQILKLKDKQYFRYIFVGIGNTVIGFSFFPTFYFLLRDHLNTTILITLSYISCAAFGFITHKFFSFRNKDAIRSQAFKYFLVQVAMWLINITVIEIITLNTGANVFITQNIISMLLIVINYFIFKKIIFQ